MLKEYEEYFNDCERANKIPLSFENWKPKEARFFLAQIESSINGFNFEETVKIILFKERDIETVLSLIKNSWCKNKNLDVSKGCYQEITKETFDNIKILQSFTF